MDKISASRRGFIGAGLGFGLAATVTTASFVAAASNPSPRTYVLAHGSFLGGWVWARVAERLRKQGHRVFAPSFTGMGDRAHLLQSNITIETFAQDLIQTIASEELTQVVLVGHSFAGVPVSLVADRIPERLAHVVMLDSVVVESGKTGFSAYPPDSVASRMAAARKETHGLAVPAPTTLASGVWGLTEGTPDYDWVKRRVTAHPLGSYTTPVYLRNPIGNHLPRTYIRCTSPTNPVIDRSAALVKSLSGWKWAEIASAHHPMLTHPEVVTALLAAV
ncbi:alpha/beta hydrolase [Pendulispora rubella]|uniref:Alpha/beta hydrolase n=1 Tax=Pendulispora rubella TaxID=2741070 RepID=A0ABZ2LE78_9BACT